MGKPKLKRTEIQIPVSKREETFRTKNAPDDVNDIPKDKLKCTVCSKNISNILKNPTEPFTHVILGVLMCRRCLTFYGDGQFEMDEDGDDKFCRWCGQGGTLYVCSKCTCAFCNKCIKRNISDRYSKEVDSDEWRCFICHPRPLYECRTICWYLQENARRMAEARAAVAAAGAAGELPTPTTRASPRLDPSHGDIRAVPEIDPNIPTTSKGLPSMNGFRGFPSPSRSSSPFDPEHGFQGFDYDETNTNGFRGFPSPSRGSSLDPEHGFRGLDYPTTSNDEANTKTDEDDIKKRTVDENDINIESAEIVKNSSSEQPVKLAEDPKKEDEEVKPDKPPKVDEEMSQEDRSKREAPKEKEEPEKMEVCEEPEKEGSAPVEEKPSPRPEAAMEEAATLPEPKEDSRPPSPLLQPGPKLSVSKKRKRSREDNGLFLHEKMRPSKRQKLFDTPKSITFSKNAEKDVVEVGGVITKALKDFVKLSDYISLSCGKLYCKSVQSSDDVQNVYNQLKQLKNTVNKSLNFIEEDLDEKMTAWKNENINNLEQENHEGENKSDMLSKKGEMKVEETAGQDNDKPEGNSSQKEMEAEETARQDNDKPEGNSSQKEMEAEETAGQDNDKPEGNSSQKEMEAEETAGQDNDKPEGNSSQKEMEVEETAELCGLQLCISGRFSECSRLSSCLIFSLLLPLCI